MTDDDVGNKYRTELNHIFDILNSVSNGLMKFATADYISLDSVGLFIILLTWYSLSGNCPYWQKLILSLSRLVFASEWTHIYDDPPLTRVFFLIWSLH